MGSIFESVNRFKLMLVVSDIHGAFKALGRVVASGQTILILGDLANLTDYRTGEGAVAAALGIDFARKAGAARGHGDFEGMRQMWQEQSEADPEAARTAVAEVIAAQYLEAAVALEGGHGYVIHGNVDRPGLLVESLPKDFEYVHGRRMEIEGKVFGFVGGGVSTPLRAAGEIDDQQMSDFLSEIGPVDILCTHVPPSLDPLRNDVVTGRAERSSEPLLDYLRRHQPRLHLFGDVHQPQATRWRIGRTQCVNVGYFRATGRPHNLDVKGL